MAQATYTATADGLIQPPPAPDGFAFAPITVGQARAMLFLCSEERRAEIRAAIAEIETQSGFGRRRG